MPTKKEAGRFGLLLDLPGAAAAPHAIPGIPGEFRPDTPTPVGGPGEIPLEQARALDANPAVHLKLVSLGGDATKED
jgi:hypothetical protein